MQAKELLHRLKLQHPPLVLDVRSGSEYASGHIPEALHAPNLAILVKMSKLPDDKNCELVITCEHGPRARMAQGILSIYGYNNTTLLDGHMSAWRSAGLETAK